MTWCQEKNRRKDKFLRFFLQPLLEAMWGMGFISAIDVFCRV